MTAALPSFRNKPILGYIHEVNGQPEFYGHNIHEDKNGDTVYDEIPVGTVPESCNATLVYDAEKGRKYVEIDGYIYEEYSKAAEILQREGECAVSVELTIKSFSYNAKEKFLDIEDFYFSGVTILGKDEYGNEVKPGMSGSNIRLKDFRAENNSLFTKDYSEELIKVQEKLDILLSRFDINDDEKGGTNQLNKFEELLAQYAKTVEDIDFDYESMTDEELEAKFAELFSDADPEPESNPDNEPEGGKDPEANPETEPEVNPEGDPNPEATEKMTRSFEISHDDIRYALYNLLMPYEDADNDWYYISAVYDTYFVYEGCYNPVIWGQSYSKEDDNVTLSGERYSLHRELLTDSEYAELKSMRENYSALVEFKTNTENAAIRDQKFAILNDEKYDLVRETDEFKALVENVDNYSVEDIEKEAKCISFDFSAKFSATNSSTNKPNKGISKKFADAKSKPKKIYGNLFN